MNILRISFLLVVLMSAMPVKADDLSFPVAPPAVTPAKETLAVAKPVPPSPAPSPSSDEKLKVSLSEKEKEIARLKATIHAQRDELLNRKLPTTVVKKITVTKKTFERHHLHKKKMVVKKVVKVAPAKVVAHATGKGWYYVPQGSWWGWFWGIIITLVIAAAVGLVFAGSSKKRGPGKVYKDLPSTYVGGVLPKHAREEIRKK